MKPHFPSYLIASLLLPLATSVAAAPPTPATATSSPAPAASVHGAHDMHDMRDMHNMQDMGDMRDDRHDVAPTSAGAAAPKSSSPAPGAHAHPSPAPTSPATSSTASHAEHHDQRHTMPLAPSPAPRQASVPDDGGAASADHGNHAGDAAHLDHTTATAGDRSPDYSDGIVVPHGERMAMPMTSLGMLRVDRLETFAGDHAHGQRWELDGWYGGDLNRLAVRSEGEHIDHAGSEGNVEALWSRAATAFWDTEVGVRHDFGTGPARNWLAVGVAGLAPYLFELRATAYVGQGGRSAVRFSGAWDWRWTQRWILEPELEANLYGKPDPARDVRGGLNDASFGLRLRYELRREFAPYVGVVWQHHRGRTARQWVAGLRFWF